MFYELEDIKVLTAKNEVGWQLQHECKMGRVGVGQWRGDSKDQ